MNCGTCKHWNDEGYVAAKNGNLSPDPTKNEPAGSCRRYAPSARQNNWRCWPVTLQSDFCHDYVEKSKVVEKVAEIPDLKPAVEEPAVTVSQPSISMVDPLPMPGPVKKAGRPKKSIDTKSGKV